MTIHQVRHMTLPRYRLIIKHMDGYDPVYETLEHITKTVNDVFVGLHGQPLYKKAVAVKKDAPAHVEAPLLDAIIKAPGGAEMLAARGFTKTPRSIPAHSSESATVNGKDFKIIRH